MKEQLTPQQQKAKELVEKFMQYTPAEKEFEFEYAKQCALIACDEQIELIENMIQVDWRIREIIEKEIQSVKQEINKLT